MGVVGDDKLQDERIAALERHIRVVGFGEYSIKIETFAYVNRERLIAFLQEEYPESLPRVRAQIQDVGTFASPPDASGSQ